MRLEAYLSRTLNNSSPEFEPWSSNVFTAPDGRPLYRPPAGGRYKYPFYFGNLDGFWIPGALARLEAKPSESVRLFANYTFVPADVMHFAGIGVDWLTERVKWSTQLYFHDQDASTSPVSWGDIPARIILNSRLQVRLDARGRFTLGLTGMNMLDVRFFYARTPGKPALAGDSSTGERLGPRYWITLEFRPFD
jgi:hypothetical protein